MPAVLGGVQRGAHRRVELRTLQVVLGLSALQRGDEELDIALVA